MFGFGWPEIIILVSILIFVAACARVGFQAGRDAAKEAGVPLPSRGEQLVGVVFCAIIFVQLAVLAVHGLHVLKNRIGTWDDVIGVGGMVGLGVIVLGVLMAQVVVPRGAA
jgi:hypothetical protein